MFDVIILGAGPAGLTAGIYSARGGLNTLVIEKGYVGGQATTTPEIVNYPGVKSADGFSLTSTMAEQAKSFGCEILTANVEKINLVGDMKTVVADGVTYEGKNVVIASGAYARKLGVENEDELAGRGVSYCATCDGGFFKNKHVVVVGGGDTAVEDALYLNRLAEKVHLVHRRDGLRANKTLSDEIKRSTVELVWNSTICELVGNPLTAVVVKDVVSGTTRTIPASGLFVAVGRIPSSDEFADVEKDENGYILTDENMKTNIDGVYAVGDVRAKTLRQIVTACADGAIAADAIIKNSL